MKRLFDLFFAIPGLIILSPLFLIIGIVIIVDSRGGVFYRQQRVGLKDKDFGLLKFRTMRTGSEKGGLLTVGGRDSRITRSGYFLRKYKLDELPQLINVVTGDMSLVGPRPEVRKYVSMYNPEQLKVLSVRPGITDLASIAYSNENELLGNSDDPEKLYIEQVMPEKLKLNLLYIQQQGISQDMKIIFRTFLKIINN